MRRVHQFDVHDSVLPRASRWLLGGGLCVVLSACNGVVTGPGAGDSATDPSQGGKGYERPNSSEGGASGFTMAQACASSTVTVAGGKWRRLTQRQYRNTVKDLLGIDANVNNFLDDSTTGSFATNTLPPQANDISAYADVADAVAALAVTDPAKLTNCNPATTGNDACAEKFIKDFGARAYRRELTPTEVTLLTDTYNLGKADGFAQGLRLVLQSILQSPNFLYLAEFGVSPMKGVAKLTSSEIASRLSYMLWNTTPDVQLMAAVKAGELDTGEGIQKHAKRMMGDARFSDALGEFFTQLFHADKLTKGTTVQKKDGAAFTTEMRQAMVDEIKSFVAYATSNGQANIKTLLTSPMAFPSPALLPIYKVEANQVAGGRFEVKDGTRAGLLTSPAFMAAEPKTPTPWGAVQRGLIVRTILMCETLPPPPPGLVFKTPDESLSQRAKLEQHEKDPSCKGCHTLMDPIGFGFENYDALGKYRAAYPNGEAITGAGEIVGDSDAAGKFANAGELSMKLGQSEQVRACMGTQLFRFAYGREPSDDDACTVESVAGALSKGDGDLPSSLLTFVVTDAFRFRGGVQ